jgi:hypothetical protein
VAAKYRFDFIPETLWFDTTAAYFILSEIASANVPSFSQVPVAPGDPTMTFQPEYSERDPFMFGFQAGLTAQPGESLRLGARASYYDLEKMNTTLVAALNGLGNGGDSVDHDPLLVVLTPVSPLFQSGASKGQMNEVQTSAFVTYAPWGPRFAVTPFYQWTSITNASAQDQGWAAGLDFGSPELLKVTVMYADVESNGTVALFTDSDLFGGVTNAKGWYLKLQRQITSALRVETTFSKAQISDSMCAYDLNSPKGKLCSTGLALVPDLAQAYSKTQRDRLLIQIDMIVVF